MISALTILLRLAGAGLILLAIMHWPIAKELNWREELKRLSPTNRSIFYVHNFFICVLLVIMGLPCLLDPGVFLENTRASAWLTWSFCGFWALRLYCQFFVYQPVLWRGKRRETALHYGFSCAWLGLVLLFGACGLWQKGVLQLLLGA
jgi:hypothetical protein